MMPQKQAFPHNPPDVYGDCFRTALACLMNLNRDDVPHFNEGKPCDNYWDIVNEWLGTKGYILCSIPFTGTLEGVLECMKKLNPGIFYLLAGKSPRYNSNHQVIAFEDNIICDPSPAVEVLNNKLLDGPCIDDGLYWINLLLPITIHKG